MASPQGSQTQYHHYIPQFILRNFSHKYHPPPRNSVSASARKRRNKKNKIYPGDSVLHTIDLKNKVPQISESPVKRTFGLMDMYRDMTNATDSNFLEKELGKLESQVSKLISDIKQALESGKSGFSMSRNQRDTLRKFLFIMKYRGPGFYQRFHGDESGEYVEDDADQFKKYMKEHGYQKPVDVWFKSITTILNLKMDLQGEWKKRLLTSIYPDDAMWYIFHTEGYFMAFCTPNNPNDEFVLTENCYNIHEGPNNTVLNPTTGKWEPDTWTSYHEFSPITPSLVLVLRSFLLPNAEEDVDESIKAWRRQMYKINCSFYVDPAIAASTLEDLPIKKPQNSYSEMKSQGLQLLPCEDGARRANHRFTFPFFILDTNQVHRINCIFLDNAKLTSRIAFSSTSSLKASLQYYLELPAKRGYKLVHNQANDPQLIYLKKLELIAKTLGSAVKLVYQEAPRVDDMEEHRLEMQKQLQKEMLESLPEQPTEFMQLYNILGGSYETLFTDMDQVKKMRFLRIKIDVCTQRFHESIREKVRNNLRDIFCQFPARRLWLYLKMLRLMSLTTPETWDEELEPDGGMDGPEDVIVKASHIVRPECLGLLLHFTVMQDIQHRLNSGLGPSSDYPLNEIGILRLQQITRLTFAPVGSIRHCGIKLIQDAAIVQSNMLRVTKAYENYMNPVWSEEENIELLTRSWLRGDMASIFSGKLPADTLEELSDVLFDIVYPAYTSVHARC